MIFYGDGYLESIEVLAIFLKNLLIKHGRLLCELKDCR